MTKWVYNFGFKKAEGNASMKKTLGGKGANLAEMDNLGISVPPGFTITTEVCSYYYKNNKMFPSSLEDDVIHSIENITKSLNCKVSSVSILPPGKTLYDNLGNVCSPLKL